MTIKPELVKMTDEAFQKFDEFVCALEPTDEDTGRFYHIVIALSPATKVNYATLRKAFEDDEQTLMAWSCRNLLELAIFTRFVLRSKRNADEFADDRLIDGRDIGVALRTLEQHYVPTVTTSALDAVIAAFSKQMSDEGITRLKFLSTKQMAEQVGMAVQYNTENKVCSKFVHPTAWSLLTADAGPGRFPDARDLLYGCGAQSFATIFSELKIHIDKWGLHHRPVDSNGVA